MYGTDLWDFDFLSPSAEGSPLQSAQPQLVSLLTSPAVNMKMKEMRQSSVNMTRITLHQKTDPTWISILRGVYFLLQKDPRHIKRDMTFSAVFQR